MDRWEQTIRNLLPKVPRRWMRWIRIPAPRWSALIVPRAGSDWRHNCSRAPAGCESTGREHNVELLALTARRFQMLWHPGAWAMWTGAEEAEAEAAKRPRTTLVHSAHAAVAATNMVTDLTTGILEGRFRKS